MLVIGTTALAQYFDITGVKDIDFVCTSAELDAFIDQIDDDEFNAIRYDTLVDQRAFLVVQDRLFGHRKYASIDLDITDKPARQMLRALPVERTFEIFGQTFDVCTVETQWSIYTALRGTWGWKPHYQTTLDILTEHVGDITPAHHAFIEAFRLEVIADELA